MSLLRKARLGAFFCVLSYLAGQVPQFSEFRKGEKVEVITPRGDICTARIVRKEPDKVVVKLQKTTPCGRVDTQITISSEDVQAVSYTGPSPRSKRITGLNVAAACVGIIFAGVAIAFGTGKGTVALAVIGGGLGAVAWSSHASRVHWVIRLARYP